jgi:L-alanine-DL-glutamate epimerase-like enolase superfamily enzyme
VKITRVTATWLRVPIAPDRQHTSDFGRATSFDTTLVRVETEGGLVGLGEAKAVLPSSGNNRALCELITHDLAPLLVGEDARDIWTVAEAKRFCREVAGCNLAWLEEPVTGDDKRGMAEVRASTDIPIAAGESEFTRFDFRDLIELRAVDVLQPDLAIAGGITEAMRIEALASATSSGWPHLWGGALMFAAGLHVAAAASSGFILEYSLGANPLLQELAVEGFPVVDGCVEIPERAGLGVTLDEAFVARYRVA